MVSAFRRRRCAAAVGVVAASAFLLFSAALSSPALAQGKPGAKPPAKGGAPGARPGGSRRSPEQLAAREFGRLEKVTGKPLTDAQKKQLVAAFMTRLAENKVANDKFNAAAAKTVGMPVDALVKKYGDVVKAERAARAGMAPGAPPAAPRK